MAGRFQPWCCCGDVCDSIPQEELIGLPWMRPDEAYEPIRDLLNKGTPIFVLAVRNGGDIYYRPEVSTLGPVDFRSAVLLNGASVTRLRHYVPASNNSYGSPTRTETEGYYSVKSDDELNACFADIQNKDFFAIRAVQCQGKGIVHYVNAYFSGLRYLARLQTRLLSSSVSAECVLTEEVNTKYVARWRNASWHYGCLSIARLYKIHSTYTTAPCSIKIQVDTDPRTPACGYAQFFFRPPFFRVVGGNSLVLWSPGHYLERDKAAYLRNQQEKQEVFDRQYPSNHNICNIVNDYIRVDSLNDLHRPAMEQHPAYNFPRSYDENGHEIKTRLIYVGYSADNLPILHQLIYFKDGKSIGSQWPKEVPFSSSCDLDSYRSRFLDLPTHQRALSYLNGVLEKNEIYFYQSETNTQWPSETFGEQNLLLLRGRVPNSSGITPTRHWERYKISDRMPGSTPWLTQDEARQRLLDDLDRQFQENMIAATNSNMAPALVDYYVEAHS